MQLISKTKIRRLLALLALCCAARLPLLGQAAPRGEIGETSSNEQPAILRQVGIDQRLNQPVPLNLTFLDEQGKTVKLGDYFGQKPVVLSLVYYQCPMLCSQVLNGLTSSFNVLSFNVGREFNVVTVSFDPRDTPTAASETKQRLLKRYRRPGSESGWHFLTGKKDQIDALAQAVGFRYAWDPQIQQYAHASGIMLLTADGHLAQYYYGIEYAPRDLKLGIVQTSQGKVGGLVDQMLLICYHYDPAKGKYGAAIFNILRVSALATMLVLGGFMFVMFRRDHAMKQRGFQRL
ncbi:MAG TPA: SCO family protein [Candidatus Angelobacter sp.]|jgi:protein SCO1/2|nr:SCO family protein [Candidatus Angelobacter sp.]